MVSFLSGTWGQRRLGAIVLVAFAVVGCGSDSSGPGLEGSTRKSAVKEEDLSAIRGRGGSQKEGIPHAQGAATGPAEKSQSSD